MAGQWYGISTLVLFVIVDTLFSPLLFVPAHLPSLWGSFQVRSYRLAHALFPLNGSFADPWGNYTAIRYPVQSRLDNIIRGQMYYSITVQSCFENMIWGQMDRSSVNTV